MSVVERNSSSRARWLSLEGLAPNQISAQDLRTLVGRTLGWQHIKSTAFAVRRTATGFSFTGRGSGHGVGLCVLGSSRLAAQGLSAEGILSRYFPGLTISARAAPALMLSLPESDEGERPVVRDLAVSTRQALERTLGVAAPDRISLRFHPTVESYQRATGQPWFTTAATVRSDVQFVPLAVLRQRGILERTVRHELVHVLTNPTLADRPLWVREGAAMYFAGERPVATGSRSSTDPTGLLSCPADVELQQPASRDALGAAYARAARCFAAQIEAGKKWTDVR